MRLIFSLILVSVAFVGTSFAQNSETVPTVVVKRFKNYDYLDAQPARSLDAFAISEGKIYAGSYSSVDIIDALNGKILESHDVLGQMGQILSLQVHDGRLYLGIKHYIRGFVIGVWDLSNWQQTQELVLESSQVLTTSHAFVVLGDVIYVGAFGGIAKYRIADGTLLKFIPVAESQQWGIYPMAMEIFEEVLFLSFGTFGIAQIKLTSGVSRALSKANYEDPITRSIVRIPGNAEGLFVTKDSVYVADSFYGLLEYDRVKDKFLRVFQTKERLAPSGVRMFQGKAYLNSPYRLSLLEL